MGQIGSVNASFAPSFAALSACLTVALHAMSLLSAFAESAAADNWKMASTAVNDGGVAIFQALPTEGNLLISPYSLQTALAMTYLGAAGETKESMGQTLRFPADSGELGVSFRSLSEALKISTEQAGEDLSFLVANRLFGQEGFEFRPNFLEKIEQDFQAPLEELDFRNQSAQATQLINSWVEEKTRERIRDLIPEGALTRDTALVLVNALYAMLPWAEEFPRHEGLEITFNGRAGAQTGPALRQTASLGYEEFPGFSAITLPFRGGDFQFVILLPKEGQELPVAALKSELWTELAKLSSRRIRLTLPKIKMEPPTLPLKDVLVGMGMPSAFDIPLKSADFDAMAPRKPDDYLYISNVFHKTFLALDEKGVEAAAATAVVMMRALAMPVQEEPLEVVVDRPFLFAIQHRPTAACIFLGRLNSLP
jgi:serpin B